MSNSLSKPLQVVAWRGTGLGLVVVATLTALKLTFADSIGRPMPFRFFLLGVLAAAWYGGTWAGLSVAIVAALVGNVVFLEPQYQLTLTTAAVSHTVFFLGEACLMAYLIAKLQNARVRQQASELETRRRDDELRIGQEWFATALRSIGDAVITTDRAGRITFLNTVAEALTGWSVDEAKGKPLAEVFRIFDETTRKSVPSPVDVVLEKGVVVGLANHTVLERRDGTFVAIDDSAAPIKSESGELAGVVLVFRNVSVERKKDTRKAFLMRATAELNSSLDYEAMLAMVARLAVPAIADWCAVDMLDGGKLKRLAVAHVDPEKVALVEEIERRYPSDPHAATGVPNVMRTGQPEMVTEIPAEMLKAAAVDDEHLRLIQKLALRSYIGVPIKHGDFTRGVVTLVMAESKRIYDQDDLVFASTLAERAAIAIDNALLFREAERLRADAAAQRDRLEAMIMAAPTAICVLRGPELVFEMMNEPYRARLGTAAAVGGLVSAVRLDDTSQAMLRNVFETGQAVTAIEKPVVADYADGRETHYLNYSIQPLRDVDGKIDRIVVFVNDVTDQVAVRKRLEAAHAEAEMASRSKDEFLAMLGHELRNPLAPILTALQLMSLRANGALERERSIIERQVKHVVRLVDDLLDVSRITRGRVELERQIVDMREIVARAIEMAGPLLEQRKHEVSVSVAEDVFVDGDPLRLAQVVANLLNNAAKYTEEGGHIFVGVTHSDGEMVLTVRDDGIGIAPEMLPRIFDLFVQERQALDRAQGGLGLGLAIVKSLVIAHGGSVDARSDGVGKGSEITLRLPAVAAPRPATPASVGEPVQKKPGVRLLVVDDNVDALELLCEALELLGYETLRAHDGPSALVLASQQLPTLGLLDIGLPAMDGYELARRLRELPGLEHMKLVALTGYGQPSDRARTSAAGFDAHLVKPVTIPAVRAVLDTLQLAG